ncbi:MAG TPA: hypothetical protein VEI07_06850 [Planctomycetaceae bacterium]|nr:hypothetical protein [Planctomycetaceae bacterium]
MRTFEYIGRESAEAQPPLLDVEFESLAAHRALCGAIVAIVTLALWLLRRRSWQSKGIVGAVGLLLPLALAGVVPVHFEVWLDGIFLGTLCGIGAWLLYELPSAVASWNRRAPAAKTRSTPSRRLGAAGTAALLAAALLSVPSAAQSDEGKAAESKASPSIVAPRPPVSGAAVIPYDSDHDPLAAGRVLLGPEAFLELWNRAHPEQPLGTHPLQEAFVTEAIYKAQVVAPADSNKSAASGNSGQVAVAGHLVLYSRVDHPASVSLPFQDAALKTAQLDGKPALLVPRRDTKAEKPQPRQYEVVLKSAGIHLLDVELELPARVAGPSGEFTLNLLPVASGRLSFELPHGASTVRINGADAGFRRRTDGSQEWIDVPIDSATGLTLSWQPTTEAGSTAQSIESFAKTLLALDDAGLRIASRFSLTIRQGGVSELTFVLPPHSKLKNLRGSDVAGWKIEGNDPARTLVVALRRKVTGSTSVDLEVFQPLDVGESPLALAAVLPPPRDVVHETGLVALSAGSQFEVRGPNLPGAARIDASEFNLAEFTGGSERQVPREATIEAAFRYAGRPASFETTISRRSSQTDVSSLYGVLVGRRKLTLSSQFHLQPAGIALTRSQFRLPAGFLVLSVEGVPLTDWYQTGVAGAKSLVVEFAAPQSAPFDLIINGTVAKNPDDSKTTLDVPTLSGARRAEARMAVWLDGSYQGTIAEAADWRSISPDQTPSAMKSLLAVPPQFAFESRKLEPASISLNLAHATARLSGDSATIVTVTDAAVFYTVALQWTITQATADTFVLTMPDWLASRLDLNDPQAVRAANPRRRQTISTALPNGRVRWTIELQDPVADQLFLTATAVLPLPTDGKIVAPALGFETEGPSDGERRFEPLAIQRHFLALVNQSTGQLSDAAGNSIETVDRGGLPMQVDANLLKQAMLVGRWTRPNATASWRLDRPSVRRGAAAFVNLADLVTVIEPGGTWRTLATYRVKNLSRQFLAVEIPERSEILSVLVRQKPARPVTSNVKGKSLSLIPLPEVSEGDLSFEVQMVVGGRLAGGALPQGVRLAGDKVALVAPQVVTWESDADYGIPVARTRWTVWLPKDEQVRVLTSSQDTNLDQTDEHAAELFERSALVEEAKQLLTVLELERSGKSTSLASGNLAKLESALSREAQQDQSGADVLQKIRARRQAVPGLQEKQAAPEAKPLTSETQSEQAQDLLTRNSVPQARNGANSEENKASEFGFRSKGAFGGGMGGFRINQGLNRQQPISKDETITEPESPADLAKEMESLKAQSQSKGEKKGADGKSVPAQSSLGLGQFGAPVFSNTPVSAVPPAAAGVAAPAPEGASAPRSPGTLSLAFAIPEEGQKLVFTKVGGDPKLTVELRPRKSLELLFGLLWMLPWLFLLVLAMILFGRNRYAPVARRQLPFGLIAVGLLLYILLPVPLSLVGLVFVAAGTVQASVMRHRQVASR